MSIQVKNGRARTWKKGNWMPPEGKCQIITNLSKFHQLLLLHWECSCSREEELTAISGKGWRNIETISCSNSLLLTSMFYFTIFTLWNSNNKRNKSVIHVYQYHKSMIASIFLQHSWESAVIQDQLHSLLRVISCQSIDEILWVINCSWPLKPNCNSNSMDKYPTFEFIIWNCT